jgi:hypothetical protein
MEVVDIPGGYIIQPIDKANKYPDGRKVGQGNEAFNSKFGGLEKRFEGLGGRIDVSA